MKYNRLLLLALLLLVLIPESVYAMHIMEGFLPPAFSIFWTVVSLPFIILGLRSIHKIVAENPRAKLLLAMAGAFIFVLSALKLPSVTGSCSHPTGVGFGTLFFGPLAMSVLGSIVLLFQALLLAHGGLTTLGANVFSMAIVGPFVAFGVFALCQRLKVSKGISIFAAASLADLLTYAMTSFQLALAFPDSSGGIVLSLTKFMGIFVWTQLPLAISEGILTVLMFRAIEALAPESMLAQVRTLGGRYE